LPQTILHGAQTMKAIVVQQHVKTVDELKIVQNAPEPAPLKKGEVLVQIKAIGLNFFDILQVQGKYQPQPPLPFIPGAEFSGVVLKTDPSVTAYKSGDRVFGTAQGSMNASIALSNASIIFLQTFLSPRARDCISPIQHHTQL